jgi:hypothetical protein
MLASGTIFFDFNLPNATTWFYFSFLLAVALFFKFSRLLSVRNWDVITVFLLVPGLLLIQDARPSAAAPEKHPALTAASLVGAAGGQGLPGASLTVAAPLARATELAPARQLWLGYLWLLCGSAYLVVRCLLDLTLVRRPALAPNLTYGGLAWLGGALFIVLMTVAYRHPERNGTTPTAAANAPTENAVKVGKEPVGLQLAQRPLPHWLLRTLAVLCHLAVAAGLVFIGARHFQDAHAGFAAATFYLMLPYTGHHVGQVHHVWPTALIVWAIAVYRMPLLAGVFLGLAAGTIYFPALLFPLWLSFYWRRGAGRFSAAFLATVALSVGVTAVTLWCSPDLARRLNETIAASDWQPWKVPNAEGIWTGAHWAYRIPVFILYLAFVVATALWPAPKNLAHVIALSAAVLIGIQFWYADQGGVYVLWYLPLFLLLVFRPNLSERYPPLIPSESDWLLRAGAALKRLACKLLHLPEPMTKVG